MKTVATTKPDSRPEDYSVGMCSIKFNESGEVIYDWGISSGKLTIKSNDDGFYILHASYDFELSPARKKSEVIEDE